MTLILPEALRAQIEAEAHAAAPGECCGLIEGVAAGDMFEARALHPARNLATAGNRFEIAPEDHLSASRTARAHGHRLIGCYHSHPEGEAEPSSHDEMGAGEKDFLWLIAATAPFQLGAFVYRGPGFEPVTLAIAADLVTTSLNERS